MGQEDGKKTGRWALVGTLAAAVLVLALAAPAGARSLQQRASGAAAKTAHVKIVDFAFKPATLHVAKGTRVVWTNTGGVAHTTTANGGAWDSGTLAPGATFARTFRKAGTFKYHCAIHSSMTGKIIVG
jgi:plastocyanin